MIEHHIIGMTLLACFSLRVNIPEVLSTTATGKFTCMNGIRFLSMAWITMGHVMMLGITVPVHPYLNFAGIILVNHRVTKVKLRI